MLRLGVSCAVRHIYIYVVRRQGVKKLDFSYNETVDMFNTNKISNFEVREEFLKLCGYEICVYMN